MYDDWTAWCQIDSKIYVLTMHQLWLITVTVERADSLAYFFILFQLNHGEDVAIFCSLKEVSLPPGYMEVLENSSVM